jgi:BASS family bile acid:Na+ symporter
MIIDIILPLSLVFIMFTLGIGLTTDDFKNIISEPKAFGLGIINQMFILPIVTFCIVIIFNLSNEMSVGMMILACCPGGVTSNIITKLSKGNTALSISFTAFVSIISVVTLPMIVGFSIQYFLVSSPPSINIFSLGLTMFLITTLPVILGLFVNMKFQKFSAFFSPIASKVSTFLFIIIVIGALASEWNLFVNNLNTLAPAIITLIMIMLAIGYNSAKWFNISKDKAITISIESGIQNATVGITIGGLILNQGNTLSVLSLPSGVYGILMYLVCFPFIFWLIRNSK